MKRVEKSNLYMATVHEQWNLSPETCAAAKKQKKKKNKKQKTQNVTNAGSKQILYVKWHDRWVSNFEK